MLKKKTFFQKKTYFRTKNKIRNFHNLYRQSHFSTHKHVEKLIFDILKPQNVDFRIFRILQFSSFVDYVHKYGRQKLA